MVDSQVISAIDIERSVLGACMTDHVAFGDVRNVLTAECFYLQTHQTIYNCLLEFERADIMLVEQRLKDKGKLVEVGGVNYLVDLTKDSFIDAEEYCQIIIEKKITRDVIQSANDILRSSQDSDAYSLVDKFSRLAGEIGIQSGKVYSLTPDQIKQRDIDNPKAEKLWFGYSELDYGIFSDSFRRGQVVLTLADSAHGKTAVTIAFVKMLLQQGRYIHWFQLEGYDSETAQAMMDISNHENIMICDSLDDIEDIKREARRVDRDRKKDGVKNGTDLIVFDYVQNIECSQKVSKTEKVEYISRQVTKLAKELNLVCNPLSQVTIDNTRTGWQQEPRYNDVRWSKQLKQDASTMVCVFRPSRIESLVENDKEVQDWSGNLVPYDSVFVKQVKVRHGKQEHKRFHMIHHNDGLKPFKDEMPF